VIKLNFFAFEKNKNKMSYNTEDEYLPINNQYKEVTISDFSKKEYNKEINIFKTLILFGSLLFAFLLIFIGTIAYYFISYFAIQVIIGRIILIFVIFLILLRNMKKFDLRNFFIFLIISFIIIIIILSIVDIILLIIPAFDRNWGDLVRVVIFFYRFIFDTVISFLTILLLIIFEIYLNYKYKEKKQLLIKKINDDSIYNEFNYNQAEYTED
jgi:hypothetical protein